MLWHWFLSGVSSPVLDLPYLSPYTAAWKSCKFWELILSFIQTVLPSFAHFTSHTQIGDETGLYTIKQRRSHLRSGQCLKLKPCNFEKSPCEYHNSKKKKFFFGEFFFIIAKLQSQKKNHKILWYFDHLYVKNIVNEQLLKKKFVKRCKRFRWKMFKQLCKKNHYLDQEFS